MKNGEVKKPIKLNPDTGEVLNSNGQEKELIEYVEKQLEILTIANLNHTAGLPSPPRPQNGV